MNRRTCWYLSTALVAAATAVGGSAAFAAGFELKEQSAVEQGAAYAGAGAVADDPSSMFYNPASITQLPGVQVSAGIAGIMPNGTLTSGHATTGALLGNTPYTGVTGTNSGVDAALPNLYITGQITDQLFAGLAVTSPFGLATKYPTNSIARYYALTTDLRTVNIGPVLAYKIMPQLSVAAGVNIETATAHLSNSVDFGSIGALHGLGPYGLLPGTADGIATLKGNDTAVGWNVGAQYEPMPGTRLGLSYRSAMFHQLTGSVIYSGVPAPLAASFQNASASAKLPEPASASFDVAQTFGNWTALGSLTYTGWSVFQSLQVYSGPNLVTATTEKFKDTLAVSLGADYRVNDQWTLRGGTMYDPTPVQNAYRTPRIADNDRIWLSIGATYHPTPNWGLSAAYSHIFANNSTVNLADAGPGTVNFLKGNLVASYNLSIDIVSVQATYKF